MSGKKIIRLLLKKKEEKRGDEACALLLISIVPAKNKATELQLHFSSYFPKFSLVFSLAPFDHVSTTTPGFNPYTKRVIGQELI